MSIDKRARHAGQTLLRQAERLTAPDLSRPEKRRRTYRLAASLTGAAIGLTAVVGVVALLRAVTPEGPVTPPPSTTIGEETTTTIATTTTTMSAAPTTSLPTTTVPDPGQILGANGWSLLPQLGEATYSDFPMRAVATGNDRLVAAGVAVEGLGADASDAQPAIWVSENGLTWDQLEQVPGSGEIVDIGWGNDTFIAVGSSGGDAAVWLSPDGTAWEQHLIPSPDMGFARMQAVIAVTDGFFAAGHESFIPDSTGWEEEDFDAAVWFSPDGLSWERIENPVFGTRGFQYPGDGEFNSDIVGIADAGWGLVFTGSASTEGSNYPLTTAVWILREEWERIDLGSEDQIKGVTAGNGVAIVHGSSEASPSADAVFYVSSDGVSWQNASGDLTGLGVGDGLQFVNDIVFVPNEGWLAVGTDEKALSTVGGAAVWIAPPGLPLTWTRLEHDNAVFGEMTRNPLGTMLQITMWRDRVIVVGGQALNVDLGDGASMCCQYAPSVWLRDSP